jgi:hypothetical protein
MFGLESLIIPAISGLAGFFGGKPRQQTQETAGSRNFSSASQETLGPEGDAFMRSLMQQILGRTEGARANLNSYVDAGVGQINDNAGIQNQLVQKMLTERGIRGPAAAFASFAPEQSRLKQIAQFRAEAPLAMMDQQRGDFSQAMQLFGMMPRGQSTSGKEDSSQRTVGTSPNTSIADMFAGAGQGLASTFGYNQRMKQLKSGSKPSGPDIDV